MTGGANCVENIKRVKKKIKLLRRTTIKGNCTMIEGVNQMLKKDFYRTNFCRHERDITESKHFVQVVGSGIHIPVFTPSVVSYLNTCNRRDICKVVQREDEREEDVIHYPTGREGNSYYREAGDQVGCLVQPRGVTYSTTHFIPDMWE